LFQSTLLRKTRILFVRTMIVVLTVTACFAALEFVLHRYYSIQQGAWTSFDSMRGWRLVPGEYRYKPLGEANNVAITINAFGLRSHSLSAPRLNTKNIVVLGDSFVFCSQTALEETFPDRLKRLLNDRVGGGWDVINAGVPAYGTSQELLLTRELSAVHHLNADIYLLMFFTNDTLDNLCLSYGDLTPQPIRPCFALDERGSPILKHLPVNDPDYGDDTLIAARHQAMGFRTISLVKAWGEDWMQTKPRLVSFLSRLGMTPRVGRMPGILNAWYRDEVLQTGVPLTSALISQMQQEIHDRGGRLLVSIVPSPFEVYPETYVPLLKQSFPGDPIIDRFSQDKDRPQRLVREMCAKAGVPFLDLLPTLLEHRETSLFIPNEGHLTRAGHKLVSETLLPFVMEYLPKDGAGKDLSH
jgi:lysophospholipase L1-like esterase